MSDEKHGYVREPSPPPIPTYDEATSSRNVPARLGPNETSDDAERQGLLSPDVRVQSDPRRRNGYYQAPSVQSVDDDGDSDLGSPVRESQDEDLRQTMEEMDILDQRLSKKDGRGGTDQEGGSRNASTVSDIHYPVGTCPGYPGRAGVPTSAL